MKVGIFGANGKVGRCLIEQLVNVSYKPVAYVRSTEQIGTFGDKVEAKLLSVEDSNVDTLAKEFETLDAVVFTAGAGGKGGADRTMQVDLDGAVKTYEACQAANVKRYIMVSAFKAVDRNAWWDGPLRTYYIAKKHADELLRNSKLDYTILQPALLQDEPGTGKITPPKDALASPPDSFKIPRQDVATCILASLKDNGTIGKTIPLISGSNPIADCISMT